MKKERVKILGYWKMGVRDDMQGNDVVTINKGQRNVGVLYDICEYLYIMSFVWWCIVLEIGPKFDHALLCI